MKVQLVFLVLVVVCAVNAQGTGNAWGRNKDKKVKEKSNQKAEIKSQEVEADVEVKDANGKFLQCCQEQEDVTDGCYGICGYDTLNQYKAFTLFVTRQCPTTAVGQYLYCFGSGSDQTECCKRKNVHKTLAGDKCLDFCDLREGKMNKMDYSYWACWSKVNDIIQCFKEHKETV